MKSYQHRTTRKREGKTERRTRHGSLSRDLAHRHRITTAPNLLQTVRDRLIGRQAEVDVVVRAREGGDLTGFLYGLSIQSEVGTDLGGVELEGGLLVASSTSVGGSTLSAGRSCGGCSSGSSCGGGCGDGGGEVLVLSSAGGKAGSLVGGDGSEVRGSGRLREVPYSISTCTWSRTW